MDQVKFTKMEDGDAEDYIFVQQPIVNIDSSSVQEMYEGLK